MRVDPQRLRAFCEAALEAAGASDSDAATVAHILVRTDLRGVHSHGVQALPIHVRNLADGGTRSPAAPKTVRESAVTAVIDGQAGMGLVIAKHAVDAAIDKARTAGVGVVLVRNSNHFGAAGHYALTAAEAGYIGLATSNASPIMAAAGSKRKVISNAPFAYAIPAPDILGRGSAETPSRASRDANFPMALDIAMSAAAGMKVRLAAERGAAIPEGWVIDADGRPTTDPGDYARGGALAPLGGHKGYGLALLTEALAGALSGAGMTSAIVPWLVDTATPTDAGHAFMVLDIECFMDRATFSARMERLIAEMHAAEPAPGVERVLVPGELEHRNERRALEHGLDLDEVIVTHLERVARELDLPLDIAIRRRADASTPADADP